MAASRYRIVLRGRLSEHFESAFDGMTLEHGPNLTVLVGDVRDQAQLYGLLDRLQEFGIELLAVEPANVSDGGSEPGAGRLTKIRPAAGRTCRRRAPLGPPSRCWLWSASGNRGQRTCRAASAGRPRARGWARDRAMDRHLVMVTAGALRYKSEPRTAPNPHVMAELVPPFNVDLCDGTDLAGQLTTKMNGGPAQELPRATLPSLGMGSRSSRSCKGSPNRFLRPPWPDVARS